MKVSFITTSSISTNPRLVKEIIVAQDIFSKVEVICFYYGDWSRKLDEKIKVRFNNNVHITSISATKQSFLPWVISSATEKLSRYISPLLHRSLFMSALASNKRTTLLLYQINRLKLLQDSSLIIAHTLGALYPAYVYALKKNIPFAFDVEDYHPGEATQIDHVNEQERRKQLLRKILPSAAYVTAASPLISLEVERLCRISAITVNNSFISSEFKWQDIPKRDEKPIKLVWFSQNINHKRGLEILLPALDYFDNKFSLTLIGNLDPAFAEEWISSRNYIKTLPPLEQETLHCLLSTFDIGLALEMSSADQNKEIALSNKIFAYKQAGLFVLATDTKAQQSFLNNFKNESTVCKQTVQGLKEGLKYLADRITTIRSKKEERFMNSQQLAFEHEAYKLLNLWHSIVEHNQNEKNSYCFPSFSSI